MPEVGAFSFPEHLLLVRTPSWRKLIDMLRRKLEKMGDQARRDRCVR